MIEKTNTNEQEINEIDLYFNNMGANALDSKEENAEKSSSYVIDTIISVKNDYNPIIV